MWTMFEFSKAIFGYPIFCGGPLTRIHPVGQCPIFGCCDNGPLSTTQVMSLAQLDSLFKSLFGPVIINTSGQRW